VEVKIETRIRFRLYGGSSRKIAELWDRHLRDFRASRNAGCVAAVSDLALIILAAPEESFDQDGISPDRNSESVRA
jgi:hypothetical protein